MLSMRVALFLVILVGLVIVGIKFLSRLVSMFFFDRGMFTMIGYGPGYGQDQ